MGIVIYHLNIRNWKRNKYSLSIDINNHNPDIILLNEISTNPEQSVKLEGFNTISKSNGPNSGVAVLVRNTLKFQLIHVTDNNTIAVKLSTLDGPIIVCTSYCPPRQNFIPTTSLYSILRHNLPTIMISDFNAHHQVFDNTYSSHPNGDQKGHCLFNLMKLKKLSFLGPYFQTFITKARRGKPDIILCNHLFTYLHYKISPGKDIGSDHIPIIAKISAKPFVKMCEPKRNLNKLNIEEYKKELSKIPIHDLDGKQHTVIDSETNRLMTAIIDASDNNSPLINTKVIQQYKPTPKIKRLLKQYQAATLNYYRHGAPNRTKLNEMLNGLINETKKDRNNKWSNLVKIASENYNNPRVFWSKIKHLKGSDNRKTHKLEQVDSDGSISVISDPQDQANLMSSSWKNVFREHTGNEFDNENVKNVLQWYKEQEPSLQFTKIISFKDLPSDHPIYRPMECNEIKKAIRFTKDKSPGLSGIRQKHLDLLPSNCITILNNIYNSILSTRYFPLIVEHIKMIFINKPNKDNKNPLNYRPICLIELIIKVFEKILAQRLLYYLEYNNLLSEKQFGFRPNRSTQHSINLIQSTININSAQGKTSLLATRDVEKAFDTVWHPGLLYKLNKLPHAIPEFLSLIHQFLTRRIIHPFFQGYEGDTFTPTAGVPQGSSIGPILYSINVNDHPNPVHKDTIICQFADDIITIVRSNIKSKYKTIYAKRKLIKELEQTKRWEQQWKIKSNPDKLTVAVYGSQIKSFNKHGRLIVENRNIKVGGSSTVLGYTLTNNKFSRGHITKTITKAKRNLNKLQRFACAPMKIKRALYKTLIRPILEYPSVPIAKTCKTHALKLQRVQNMALRFISNTKLSDKVSSISLHERLNMEPLNTRAHKLAIKTLNKMKNVYSPKTELNPVPYYKYSDYSINDIPLKQRKRPVLQRILKHIALGHKKVSINVIKNPNSWASPIPLFS